MPISSFPNYLHLATVGKGLGDFHFAGAQRLAQSAVVPVCLPVEPESLQNHWYTMGHERTPDKDPRGRRKGRPFNELSMTKPQTLTDPNQVCIVQPAMFPSVER